MSTRLFVAASRSVYPLVRREGGPRFTSLLFSPRRRCRCSSAEILATGRADDVDYRAVSSARFRVPTRFTTIAELSVTSMAAPDAVWSVWRTH